jgi:hypothetical protein
MPKRVYVETTIPSFYFEPRGEPEMVARRNWTVAWWSAASGHFLVTWNCGHLANANTFEHVRHVNTLLGLFVPTLTTPVELLSSAGETP